MKATTLSPDEAVQLGMSLLLACRVCHEATDQEDQFGEPLCSPCAAREFQAEDEAAFDAFLDRQNEQEFNDFEVDR